MLDAARRQADAQAASGERGRSHVQALAEQLAGRALSPYSGAAAAGLR